MEAEKIETLMRAMRERAIEIERLEQTQGAQKQAEEQTRRVRDANKKKLERLTKLYFDAGRWAGGARDYLARQSFELMNKRENELTR